MAVLDMWFSNLAESAVRRALSPQPRLVTLIEIKNSTVCGLAMRNSGNTAFTPRTDGTGRDVQTCEIRTQVVSQQTGQEGTLDLMKVYLAAKHRYQDRAW